MKKRLLCTLVLTSALLVSTFASASPVWYDIKFTGADIWGYSADNASQARYDQTAPRRYATYNNDVTGAPDGTGSRVLQDTTYGVNGLPTTGFNGWAPGSGFAFDEINLWGAGATGDWRESYISAGNSDPGAEGMSSWKVIQAPTGWSSGIVKGNEPYSADATHAFPVWRSSGTADALGIANMNDPSFAFEVQVLIDTISGGPADSAACAPTCTLRVFFGGFNDDLQQQGPDNFEVSGIMTLRATAVPTAVPEPATLALLGLGLAGLAMRRRKVAS